MPALVPAADWSYHPPGDALFADVDVVRFYLQDTDSTVRLLSDAEIQWLIDVWMPKHDSLVYVAAIAADRVSAKFASVVNVSADGVSVNTADLTTRYAALAAQLRQTHKDHQVGGEVDITNLMWGQSPDWSIEPLHFGVGKDDNPDAGRQNYGSHRGTPYTEDTVRPGY